MKTGTWLLAATLLLANLAGTAWLILNRVPSEGDRLSETTMVQVDKLFKLMSDFQTELQNVTAQANYPDDKAKELYKNQLRIHTTEYEVARLAYSELRVKRSKDSLLRFLEASGCLARRCLIMQPTSFTHWSGAKWIDRSGQPTDDPTRGVRYEPGKEVSFGNTSKLESLEDEFEVLLVSMLRDIK